MRFLLHIISCLFVSLVLLGSSLAQGKGYPVRSSADSVEVQTLLAEGDVFYRRLDNNLAITSYRKAYDLDSTSFDVLTRLARTANDLGKDLQAEGEDEDAEQTFLEAVNYAEALESQYADTAKTHFYLALTKGNLALFRGGRQKVAFGREVETHCLKGIALDSMDAHILVAYGVFNREVASSSWMERALAQALFGSIPEGTKEEAVELLSRAVELRPDLHIARFELALALISTGQSEQAVLHLRQAKELPAQTTQDNRNRQLAARMLDRMP